MRTAEQEIEVQTVVASFTDHARAVAAAHALDEAGIPPDRVGVVAGNVRQAREAAGSFSGQGAIVGALIGALVAVAFVVAGGETMRQNVVAILLGAPALIIAFAAIGALAGRAKIFQRRDYEHYEREVELGETLVTVTSGARELALASDVLSRLGARALHRKDTTEAV